MSSWFTYIDTTWPGWLDKRPGWLEAMERLADKYGAANMTASVADLEARWRPRDWGIGDRPPTPAEWRAVLGDVPSWVLSSYNHLRQFLNMYETGNDYHRLTPEQKAEIDALVKSAVQNLFMPK